MKTAAQTVVDGLLVAEGTTGRNLLEAPQHYAGDVVYMRPENFGKTSRGNFASYTLLGNDHRFVYVVNSQLTAGAVFLASDVESDATDFVPVTSLLLRESPYRGYRQAYRLRVRKDYARLNASTNWYLLFVQRYGGIVSDAEHLEGGRLLWRSLLDGAASRGFRASVFDTTTGTKAPISSETADTELWTADQAGRQKLLVLERT